MDFQAVCQAWRGFLTIALVTLAVVLSACSNRLALPGLQPTAQPVAVAADKRFEPTLMLNPPSGHAGVYVQVNGAGWPPNMMVVVVLTDPSGISTTVASKDTDNTGNLTTGFLYPIDSRWLLDGPYVVAAESADGKYQATAEFAVVEPGSEMTPAPATQATDVPTAMATNAVAAEPTATVIPTLTPTPTPTPAPQPTATPTAEARTVEAAPSNSHSTSIAAALVPVGERRGPHRRYRVEIIESDPNDTVREIVAILALPPIPQVEKVELKRRDKFEMKVNKDKVEISAPDPEAVLTMLQIYGGIEVEHGQRIRHRMGNEGEFKLESNDDELMIETSSLLLQITTVDAAGQTHQFTVSPPIEDGGNNGRSNRGRGNDNSGDSDDDDDNGDHD